MNASPEYLALKRLQSPDRHSPGDMWLCRRLGIVSVYNGHKRGQKRCPGFQAFHLYHWRKPSLTASPSHWRECDPNGGRPLPECGNERWEYIGNIFDLLPYERLAGSAGAAPNV